ncbi:zinc transporter ZIP9-like [Oncorhynchus nerka]|uniref:zinc transporter ZIP9-like n=1 Tax=Oncorhynchus nerka TaxID=8023 RepID=UPI0031B878FD
MDEAMAIILISIVMFLGCFLLGLIPLLIKLSEKRLQFVSIFGAGLLCGTALAIILPEGVELLEESWRVSSCSVAPVAANKNASDGGVGGQLQEMGPSKGLPARFFIGVSLVLGFILMFLVDQISSYCSIHDQRTGTSNRTTMTATVGLVIHAAVPYPSLLCREMMSSYNNHARHGNGSAASVDNAQRLDKNASSQ